MADGTPAVSVIMPVRNGASYIAEAIQSCLAQTFSSLELLVADDGSTDGSLDIARREGDDRLVFMTGGPSNPSAARNRAIARARGTFLAFLDADDLWYPQKIERQLREFEDRSVVAVGALFRFRIGDRAFGVSGQPIDDVLLERVRMGRFMPVTTSSLVVRRSSLLEVGAFDELLARAADIDILARLASIGTLVIVEEFLGEYRIHGENISRVDPEQHHRWMSFVGERIAARERGEDLLWEDFVASQQALAPRERRRARSAALYRQAGTTYASGRRFRGIATVLHALAVDPRYTVSKVRQQQPWRLA